MRKRHKYDLAKSPGRLASGVGAALLTLGIGSAAILGQAEQMLDGFGAPHLLTVLAPLGGTARAIAVAILLGYPALYALSLVSDGWTQSRAAHWLGRRVRGSLCLLWTTLASAILLLHCLEGHTYALALGFGAAVFALSGVAVRWLERESAPQAKPFARMVPAALLTLSSLSIALIGIFQGIQMSSVEWWMATSTVSGAALLLLGSARDVIYLLSSSPRRLISQDALERALRSPR